MSLLAVVLPSCGQSLSGQSWEARPHRPGGVSGIPPNLPRSSRRLVVVGSSCCNTRDGPGAAGRAPQSPFRTRRTPPDTSGEGWGRQLVDQNRRSAARGWQPWARSPLPGAFRRGKLGSARARSPVRGQRRIPAPRRSRRNSSRIRGKLGSCPQSSILSPLSQIVN